MNYKRSMGEIEEVWNRHVILNNREVKGPEGMWADVGVMIKFLLLFPYTHCFRDHFKHCQYFCVMGNGVWLKQNPSREGSANSWRRR